jgi:hypothetical protein
MAFLIDINALLALAWPNHPHHGLAVEWFDRIESTGWASCATTQLGFVRISSQPKFSPHHVSPGTACELLGRLTDRPHHIYWREEDNGLGGAKFQGMLPNIQTHHFVTDGFLVSVALANGGKLATFDRPLANLFPSSVEVIS